MRLTGWLGSLPPKTARRIKARLDELGVHPEGVDDNDIISRIRWASEHGLLEVPDRPSECPRCGGAGFVRKAVPLGHPEFGRTEPCQTCGTPTADEAAARLWRLSGIPEHMRRLTFARFDAYQRDLEAVKARVAAWAEAAVAADGSEGQRWLLLSGPFGVGKTHLAVAAAQRFIASGRSVLYTPTPRLLDRMRATYAEDAAERIEDVTRPALEYDLLVLDDFGAERATEYAEERLYNIINHRYERGLPLIVTTNVQLEYLEPRVRSRLSDRRLVLHLPVDAEDYRQR